MRAIRETAQIVARGGLRARTVPPRAPELPQAAERDARHRPVRTLPEIRLEPALGGRAVLVGPERESTERERRLRRLRGAPEPIPHLRVRAACLGSVAAQSRGITEQQHFLRAVPPALGVESAAGELVRFGVVAR